MNKSIKPYGKTIKKAVVVIYLLCLLLSFGAITVSAQEITNITVSSCTVERSENASVSFNLENNPGIWGLKLRIHYDHSALTLNSVSTGSVFNEGEFVMSESLSKDPYVITACGSSLANKTANGKIVILNFTVNSNAAVQSYPVSVEVSQMINVDGDKINVSAVDGNISVVACKHTDKEWRITTAAGCEKTGIESLICKDCGEAFETRTIKATGHQHTEIKNVVAATKTAEGYTGDTYCKDCGKLIGKGKAIAKLENDKPVTNPTEPKPPVTNPIVPSAPIINIPNPIGEILPFDSIKPSIVNPPATSPSIKGAGTSKSTAVPGENKPEITSGSDSKFIQNSGDPLVFVSNAEFSEFVRVEIDGSALAKEDFSVESGSTIVKISAGFLSKLSVGEHTVSIVSTSGTASTQFKVESEPVIEEETIESTVKNTAKPISDVSDDTETETSARPIIIIVIIVVLLIGVAGAFFVIKKRRSL